MPSEDPVQPEQPAPTKKARPEMYKIHSMVRSIETRLQRMRAPIHHRFVQRFGGGAITVRRARPATVSRPLLERHLVEIKKAVEDGKVVVKTMTGDLVDLGTLEVIPVAKVTPPKPNRLPDSAANDLTFPGGVGQKVEQFEGGGVEGEETPLNILPPLTSDDVPITTAGDPAKARAAQEQQEEKDQEPPPPPPPPPEQEPQEQDQDGEFKGLLGDDEPTQPDVVLPSAEQEEKVGKRSEEKHSSKKSRKGDGK